MANENIISNEGIINEEATAMTDTNINESAINTENATAENAIEDATAENDLIQALTGISAAALENLKTADAKKADKKATQEAAKIEKWANYLSGAHTYGGKYLLIIEDDYKNLENNPNWHEAYYLLKGENFKLTPISFELGREIREAGLAKEISKETAKTLKKAAKIANMKSTK